ncbi:PepSY-like domain-containing protein [Chitinophaga sp. RCC_12]|uniref:PepSY-like domain-containing protein n=1 Tax=Chitinophaga sp. RCC_12 TaxID=3239226 RepID=UPI00352377E2
MKLRLLFAAIFIPAAALAQDIPASQVPAAVTTAFKAKFPNTSHLEWEKKGTLYEAEFHVNNVDHKALLSEQGQLQQFKEDIPVTDLPQAVKQAIKTNYKAFRIDDAEKVTRGSASYYQVELDGEPHDQKIVMTPAGKVVQDMQYW